MKWEESVYLFSKFTIELRNSKLCATGRGRDTEINEWNRRGNPETDPHKYAQLRSKSKSNGGTSAFSTNEA